MSDTSMMNSSLQLIEAGGPVVIILLILSVVAATVIVAKLWQFRLARIGERMPAREALGLYRAGEAEAALNKVSNSASPLGQTLAALVRGRERGLADMPLQAEVTRQAADRLEELRRGLRLLELIGALAPLLGLFGTVIGMIDAFRDLEAAGSQVDPSTLSGGIWVALLTTAVGLAVAIPVVAAVTLMERRVEALAHQLEDLIARFFGPDLEAPDLAAAATS